MSEYTATARFVSTKAGYHDGVVHDGVKYAKGVEVPVDDVTKGELEQLTKDHGTKFEFSEIQEGHSQSDLRAMVKTVRVSASAPRTAASAATTVEGSTPDSDAGATAGADTAVTQSEANHGRRTTR